MQKEEECPCLKHDCPQRGYCVAGYLYEISMGEQPECMRPGTAVSKELEEKVIARLIGLAEYRRNRENGMS